MSAALSSRALARFLWRYPFARRLGELSASSKIMVAAAGFGLLDAAYLYHVLSHRQTAWMEQWAAWVGVAFNQLFVAGAFGLPFEPSIGFSELVSAHPFGAAALFWSPFFLKGLFLVLLGFRLSSLASSGSWSAWAAFCSPFDQAREIIFGASDFLSTASLSPRARLAGPLAQLTLCAALLVSFWLALAISAFYVMAFSALISFSAMSLFMMVGRILFPGWVSMPLPELIAFMAPHWLLLLGFLIAMFGGLAFEALRLRAQDGRLALAALSAPRWIAGTLTSLVSLAFHGLIRLPRGIVSALAWFASRLSQRAQALRDQALSEARSNGDLARWEADQLHKSSRDPAPSEPRDPPRL